MGVIHRMNVETLVLRVDLGLIRDQSVFLLASLSLGLDCFILLFSVVLLTFEMVVTVHILHLMR